MEKRAMLAIALSAALFLIYQMFLMPRPPEPGPETGAKGRPIEQAPVAAPAPSPTTPVDPVERTRDVERPSRRLVPVDTPLYRAAVDSDGGGLETWTLQYRGEKPLVVSRELGWQGVRITRGAKSELVPFVVSPDELALGDKQPAGTLALSGDDGFGLRVTETLGFRADRYVVDVVVKLENGRHVPQTVEVALPMIAPAKPGQPPAQWPAEAIWTADGTVHRDADLAALGQQELTGSWVALGNVYYLLALIPKSPGLKLHLGKEVGDRGGAETVEVSLREKVTIGPGQSWEGRALLYAGPKEYDRLKGLGLEGAVDFGGFPIPRRYGGLPMEWLGVPVLWLMNRVYHYIGNYGIAIILLTVITKILFFPLTMKSVTSMKRMQATQPQVNAIRAKFRNDPQRAQREMMELYRKEGVNPLGGCLPMIVQFPIFYALYVALSVSVELQNAPFMCFGTVFGVRLWICDLATQDPIYVLPILMGVTMFIQQKMTPVMGDPRQAKLMLFMPFVFTFMFLNLPSGLVLYWTVSNVLQILQQYLMNRMPADVARRAAKGAAHA